jgi:hypothetical protein
MDSSFSKSMGHSRKHPYHPHGGNSKLTPLPPSDVLIHLLLSETIFSPPPDGRNFLCGGSMDLFWNDPMFNQHKVSLWYERKLMFS